MNHYWDLFHLDLKTAFPSGGTLQSVISHGVVQLPPDIGLPTWMVGLCLRPVYGRNDAPRRWWNVWINSSVQLAWKQHELTDATYVAYDGIEGKKGKSYLAAGSFSQEKEPGAGSTSQEVELAYLKELDLHAMSCYASDEGSRSSSDRAEERSYLSCPDIAQCFQHRFYEEDG